VVQDRSEEDLNVHGLSLPQGKRLGFVGRQIEGVHPQSLRPRPIAEPGGRGLHQVRRILILEPDPDLGGSGDIDRVALRVQENGQEMGF